MVGPKLSGPSRDSDYRRITLSPIRSRNTSIPLLWIANICYDLPHICKSTPLERVASSLPFHSPFFQIPDLVSSFHQHSGFQNRLFPTALRTNAVQLSFSPVNTGPNRYLPLALTLTKEIALKISPQCRNKPLTPYTVI
jgi:hypothetical protein